MDDLQLIASLKRGNDHAFSLLINKYKDMVFSVCIKITEDYHLAEEAAQDTFLKVYQQHARFKGNSKLSSWIYRIAINTSYNKIRQRKPVESLDMLDENTHEVAIDNGFEQMAKKDRINCINLALAQLDKLDALVMTLFYLEELSIAELMEATELSEANIKVKLYRGRKKLNLNIRQIMNKEIDSIK